jgi:hypothetical protein
MSETPGVTEYERLRDGIRRASRAMGEMPDNWGASQKEDAATAALDTYVAGLLVWIAVLRKDREAVEEDVGFLNARITLLEEDRARHRARLRKELEEAYKQWPKSG